MRIAIIGAGITGLTAAYELSKKGHTVSIFERSDTPGGLGTYLKVGKNSIERFYHHFFTSDKFVIEFIKELGIGSALKFYPAKTSIYHNETVYPFSSPIDLLHFSPLSIVDRLRLGFALAYLKYLPVNIQKLDRVSAKNWLLKFAGYNAFNVIWESLLVGKFAEFADEIPAAWLRERIRDRTFKLGYLDGGAQTLFDTLIADLKKRGVSIHLSSEITGVESKNKKVFVTETINTHSFDACIITTVSPIASKLIKNRLPQKTKYLLDSQDELGAVCLLLELKRPVQKHYWINICDLTKPVLVMVEHTNMISKKAYSGRSLVYLANYIHRDKPSFRIPDHEVIYSYSAFLKELNPDFHASWITKATVSRVPRAQTIFGINAFKKIPPVQLPVKGIYLANIDQMYPHDRNFNLGVELGRKVATLIE